MITSTNTFLAGIKQDVTIDKTASRTAVATGWFSVIDLAGQPGAGVLAVGNTANGVVPTDTTSGHPTINAFSGSNKGQLAVVRFSNSVACRIKLIDRLFHCGAYAFNANTSLASQPNFSSRLINSEYKDTSLWVECVTAMTGNLTVVITYVNQDGTAGRTATLATGAALTVGRMMQIPLQSGDTGIQQITSIVGSVATVGTFNIVVLRELWEGRVNVANFGDVHGMVRTGIPQLFDDSALEILVAPDSTATGVPSVKCLIVNTAD